MKASAAIAFVLLVALSRPAAANSIDDCRAAPGAIEPGVRLSACTEIIMSPIFSPGTKAQAFRFRGELHNEAGAFREAIADFDEALRREPGDAASFAGRGWAKFSIRDFGGALADYDSAIRLDPNEANFYLERGHVQLAANNADASMRDLTEAIRIDPESAVAYNNRGLAFRRKGELDAALRDYDTAIKLNPVYALAFANRGYLQEARGQRSAAIEDLRRALLLDPSLVEVKAALQRMGEAAPAESDRRIREGRDLTERNCSRCHAVGSQGASPNPRAPEFRNLRRLNTLLALRKPISRGIAAPHDQMPRFTLSDDQIDSIVAYINNLAAAK